MKIKECNYELETKFVKPCGPCRKSKFTLRYPVKIGKFYLYVNLHYSLNKCFKGITEGQFVNAFTLLPCEELELEIIRKSKYSQSFHEERSLETSFEYEITNNFRKEITKKLDVNYNWEVDGGIDLFVFDASTEFSGEVNAEYISNTIRESTATSSYKISKSQDFVIDLKSEIEHGFKSLRKIKNPNNCKAVTYFFYQLNKKYEISLELERVSFDFGERLISKFNKLDDTFLINQNTLKIESDKLNLIPELKTSDEKSVDAIEFRSLRGYSEEAKIERSIIREFSDKNIENLLKQKITDKETYQKVQDKIKVILSDPKHKIGTIWTNEFCLRTNSTIVEPKVSECSVCEPIQGLESEPVSDDSND